MTKTPWHLWVVGGLTFLWNCGGVWDYIMNVTRNPEYLAQMTPEQLAMMEAMPTWATAAFAISVFTSLAGSLLLLLRNRWAVWAFAVSLAAFLVNTGYFFIIAEGGAAAGTFGLVFTALIFAVMAFELWYARMMRGRGVLR